MSKTGRSFTEKLAVLGALVPATLGGSHYTFRRSCGSFQFTVFLTDEWATRSGVKRYTDAVWYETEGADIEALVDTAISWLEQGPTPPFSGFETEEHARVYQAGFDSVLTATAREYPHLRTAGQVANASLAGDRALRDHIAAEGI